MITQRWFSVYTLFCERELTAETQRTQRLRRDLIEGSAQPLCPLRLCGKLT
jgi:hypothetical protein